MRLKQHPKKPSFSSFDGGKQFYYKNSLYHRVKKLGAGAYGATYLFHAPTTDQQVVVKFELPQRNCRYSPNGRRVLAKINWFNNGESFYREYLQLKKLYNPVAFAGIKQNRTRGHYILMPYIKGKTLADASLYTSIYQLISIWNQTAAAVIRLHDEFRVKHGDLHRGNIIYGKLEGEEGVYLIDFGMAREHADCEDEQRALGYLLLSVYQMFLKKSRKRLRQEDEYRVINTETSNDGSLTNWSVRQGYDEQEEYNVITNAAFHLSSHHQQIRWTVQQTMYILASTFLVKVPASMWILVMRYACEHHLQKARDNQSDEEPMQERRKVSLTAVSAVMFSQKSRLVHHFKEVVSDIEHDAKLCVDERRFLTNLERIAPTPFYS